MADTNSYIKVTNLLNYSVALNPTAAFPIDARSMFGSYDEAYVAAQSAENAGSTNTVYYIGQMLTVYENGIVSHYSIQPDKTLKAVGAQVLGDDKSIVIGDDGKVTLKGFGTKYYKYISKDTIAEGTFTYPDSMPTDATTGTFAKAGDVWYVLGEDGTWSEATTEPVTEEGYELTEGWTSGLTPQVIMNEAGNGYELAWFEPSKITVEGLSSSMASLQNDVTSINTKVDANKTDLEAKITAEQERAIGVETGLRTDVNANTAAIKVLNGDATTEGSVDYKIAAVLDAYITGDGDTSKMDSLKDMINWAETHNTEVASYGTDIAANKKAIEDLEALVGPLPEGTQATTVIAYVQELVAEEKTRAEAKEKELEGAIFELNNKALTDASQFATAAQGAKADTAVQQVVAGETNGHIAVDGTDVKVYELEKATVTTLGGIKPDGSSLSVNSDGVASVAAVDYTKVTGLDTQLTSIKEAAVEEANTYTDDNAVAKTDIATSTTVAESVDAASDGKVISEKVFLDAMNWKTTM